MYDLLIRGGHVIDPMNGVDALCNVAINGGSIVGVTTELGADDAKHVVDADGLLVVPGLIDLHVHVHWGVSHYGIEADQACLARGTTTAVDAGSAGAYTYPSLKRWVMDTSQTELYAFLNVAYPGMIGDQVGELEDLRFIDVDLAARVAAAHEILGIKVRLDRVGQHPATTALSMARDVAERVAKPLMVHIGSAHRMHVSLDSVLSKLRPGDIVTHMYHGRDGGLLDDTGAVCQSIREARRRGIVFDVGHGAGSWSFAVARRALDQGFGPDVISSDLHTYSLLRPVVDLPTTMTKFLHLGMPLGEVIAASTAAPAGLMGMSDRIGGLGPGSQADVTMMRLVDGPLPLYDCEGRTESASKHLQMVAVIKRGKLVGHGPMSALGTLTLDQPRQ